jgi:phosphohistidine phosphatase
MFLYLVQHAEALPEDVDPTRSLSEKGIGDIKRVAEFVAKMNITPKEAYHSGKMRALQTAQILNDYLRIEKGISETDALAPMDDPQTWFERISKMNEDLMLVGHLPHLARLAALILCGDEKKNIVDFKMGGIVCLKRFENANWSVEWMIIPEVVK